MVKERKLRSTDFPQWPAAPEDYPTFPDNSTWPVIFPELPPSPDGGPRRPPQHPSKAAAPTLALATAKEIRRGIGRLQATPEPTRQSDSACSYTR